jgi:hypothetical protein
MQSINLLIVAATDSSNNQFSFDASTFPKAKSGIKGVLAFSVQRIAMMAGGNQTDEDFDARM